MQTRESAKESQESAPPPPPPPPPPPSLPLEARKGREVKASLLTPWLVSLISVNDPVPWAGLLSACTVSVGSCTAAS